MKIAIACLSHESNTFSTLPTALDDFNIREGHAVIDYYAPTFHEVAGFIAGATEYGYDLVPLMAADATPSGAVTADAYETLTRNLLAAIEAAPHIDGILLALHGAMVAENYPHADAETVHRVRALIGPDMPLVVTHDYHGNVPPQLIEDADALVIYKTCPHIDQKERGLQAAKIITRIVRGEVRPQMAIAKPEVLFNIMFHNTNQPPMQPLMQAAIDLEAQPGILACSIAAGYQYADVPWMGPSIVVVSDGDADMAQREAERLGAMMWDVREQLIPDVPDAETAVKHAMAADKCPIALFDLGDNVGGGSAADATTLLKALIDLKANGWVVTLYDPESVSTCVEAGIGAEVALNVGGKIDNLHGPTVPVSGRVKSFHDGRFIETERRHGGQRVFNQGLTVVVDVNGPAPDHGGFLILTSRRITPMSIHQITSVGIQPAQQRILIAKGAVAPRAAYEPVCVEIIEVDTPGATAINRAPAAFHQARKSFFEWANQP